MTISEKAWAQFIGKLRRVNEEAARKIQEYMQTHGTETEEQRHGLIDFAYLIAARYGEGAAALACAMYDAVAEAAGVSLPAALPAETPTITEVAKTVNGTLKTGNPDIVAESVGRLVKRTGVDTTMQNAIRDGAEWAWVPQGDTCAFCITLASRGWQRASKKALKDGHAEHIHANCDCTYAVRFDTASGVARYDPDRYLRMYRSAEGDTPAEKINALRREFYAENREEINAQKRSAYARRTALESSAAEELEKS